MTSFTPFRWQAISISSARPSVSAMGFSHRMALGLRAAAVTVQGAWPVCHVQIDTTSRRSASSMARASRWCFVWIPKRASISRIAFSSRSARAATS